MGPFWDIFRPGEKNPGAEQQNQHTGRESSNSGGSNSNSLPQPATQPRAPTFERYPPPAQGERREWTPDLDGQQLHALWERVSTDEDEGQPLTSRPGFMPFVTALTRVLESDSGRQAAQSTAEAGAAPAADEAVRVVPALPAGVVRGLAEAVLSASICRCGREVATGEGKGCPTHGFSAVSWGRIISSGTRTAGAEAISAGGGQHGMVSSGGIDDEGASGSHGGDAKPHREEVDGDRVGFHSSGGIGTSRRRACLVATLRALSAACRWPHTRTREELARHCRGEGGGLAAGLALLCDALCVRVTELKRRQQGPFRRSYVAGSVESGRARQDLLFFARCLDPLAGVVANSAPAGTAWYDLLNAKTLLGTGLPNHPWVGETDSSGGVVPTGRPVVDATTQGYGNHDGEAALFLAMASAADKDEWSAMLVGAGLVRSLANSLQACLDFRTAVRGLDSTKVSAVAGKSDSSARGGNSSSSSSSSSSSRGGGTDSFRWAKGDARGEVLSDGCLWRELETTQVLVVVALGALLSAHPLAARDRFQLSGGMLRVHRVIFQQPKNSRVEETHQRASYRGEGCTAAAATLASPFLQEHCALVALQVLRLCLRANDAVKELPPDVLEGVVRLVGTLAPSMRMTWNKGHVTPCGPEGGSLHVGLPDSGEERGPEVGESGCDRRGGLSHRLLPLGLLDEVPSPMPEARVASLSDSTGPAAEAKPPLDASSYRLCGLREEHTPSPSTSAGYSWAADGLQLLGHGRVADAERLVCSLHARLVTSLDAADIVALANGRTSRPPSSLRGNGEAAAEAGAESAMDGPPRASPLSQRSVLLLVGFFNGILEIVGDCKDGRGGGRGSTETRGTGHVGFGVDNGDGVQGAVLQSALASLVEFLEDPKTLPSPASPENSGARDDLDIRYLPGRGARDKFSLDCEGFLRGNQERANESSASRSVDLTAAAPVRQLIALRFLHQAVRCWPWPTVKLMQQAGLWDVLFSDRFLSGGSRQITRAIECLRVTTADDGRGVSDGAVGWGLVHDGTLLLLETVVVVRCFRQVGQGESAKWENEQGGRRAIEDQESGPARSSEIAQYVSFLAGGEGSQPCAVATMQGGRWLRAIVAMEAPVGTSVLQPQSLRVTALCLAFQLCDRGNCTDSDLRVSEELEWPLMHTSLSLAAALVSSNSEVTGGELLFQAAVAYALDAEVPLGVMAPAPAKSRVHRPTASLTSDASSPAGHAINAWGNPSSGGSRTPASVNSLSSRGAPSVLFGDNHNRMPSPRKPPRPLPEVLFKAALDLRARHAVFGFIVLLGVEAGREALASLDVHKQRGDQGVRDLDDGELSGVGETAAAVLSGLAEGFLCLCERAAVATVAGSAASDDGPGLLFDALHGACALMRSNVPQGDKKTGPEGASIGSISGSARGGGNGVSPLPQEAFREHWASDRLLVVLESVVGGRTAASSSTLNLPPVSTEICSGIVTASLSLFTTMMAGNSLGKRAFQRALSDHHGRKSAPSGAVPSSPPGAVKGGLSFIPLADLASVMPPSTLCRALMDMLMDGEVSARALEAMVMHQESEGESEGEEHANTPEIRNPFVVPLIFRLLPDWPASEQEHMMRVFRLLLTGAGGGMVNRSLCCEVQPALMDQLLDMLPRLDEGGSECEDGLQGRAIDLVRHLGSHSVNVAQLKKVFRLLQPLSTSSTKRAGTSSTSTTISPLQPSWMCSLLRALRGMMGDRPGPQRFFLFDGLNSGLRLPRMPRWPAKKGYTFSAWVRLEEGLTSSPSAESRGCGVGSGNGNRITPTAEAPCLFSFCGEQRGQGVAACFIPLRKKRRSVQRSVSAPETRADVDTPQDYALELRVGAGRKKPPTIVRFPGITVTAGEWVFVAVAHAASRWGQRGEASVLVDNCWCTSASPFPRFGDGGVATASIACHYPRQAKNAAGSGGSTETEEGAGAKVTGRPVLCSLRGQMGPIYLFAGSIPEAILRGVRQLGPGYAFSFEPPQVDSREVALIPTSDPSLQPLSELGRERPDASEGGGLTGANTDGDGRSRRPQAAAAVAASAQHLYLTALSGALTPRILLAYNPSVWGGEYFLDNTPEHNPVRWINGGSQGSSGSGGGTARRQMIYSMAGSQAYVLIQPPSVSNPCAGGGGGSDNSHRGRYGTSRGPWGHRPDAPGGRSRGWSGCSGCSGVDDVFGGDDGERITPVRPRRRPGHMHAMRLPGTRECVTRDVRDALDCLGGVKVLLPLFAQYDHGVLRGGATRVSFRTDPRLNETVLALLAGTLRDSGPNRRFLRRHGGLSLLPHCLERVSPQHMSAGALAQACRLTERLGSWSEEWADSAIESLLSPSRLWVFAPTEAQLTLVGVLRGLTRRCPGRMRRVVGVQQCLDALDLYYWYSPPVSEVSAGVPPDSSTETSPTRFQAARASAGGGRRSSHGSYDLGGSGGTGSEGWSYASRQWVHPSTGEVLGAKASGAVLREIRARLLDTATLMACDGDGVRRAEVAAVLGFLRGCRDDASRCEALRLVLRLTDEAHQAGRFVVASGYVAAEAEASVSGEEEDGDGGDGSTGRGPGRGGTAVALFLSLLRASDPIVRLLAFLALGQMLIACLRIDERSRPEDDGADKDKDKVGAKNQQPAAGPHPSGAPMASSSSSSSSQPGVSVSASNATTTVAEFMGGADAKAEELVVLTGASSFREGGNGGGRNAHGTQGRRDDSDGSNGREGNADLLELRGGAWEHMGLPRHKIVDVLQWAQRQVTGTEDLTSAGFNSTVRNTRDASFNKQDGAGKRKPGESSQESRERRLEGEASADTTVARVTMEVLQGLLIGQLPRGFAARVVNSQEGREQPQSSKTPAAVSPATNQPLDPFFLEVMAGSVAGSSAPGDKSCTGTGGAPSLNPRPRARSWRNGQSRSSSSSGPGRPPPLCICLPEVFPALCQQVAMAPLGAALRGEVMETLVAAVQSQRNAEHVLSVDSWQQYLLSVVSSAQGRQAVATAAAAATAADGDGDGDGDGGGGDGGGPGTPSLEGEDSTDGLSGDGDTERHDRRNARDEAAKEGRLVNRTVKLICWLAMCKARSGSTGRPGAGFAELQDTMSFLRCQRELGTMECMSVGESMLRHMVNLLKRELDCLESEVNGWARGSHLPSFGPMLGTGGGRHGAAAALACVWPLAALVVEFITIPPVANPPAASAMNAPTPSAAALAVLTAAIGDDEGSPSRWSEESLTCPSPMQGILQWLDTGLALPSASSVPPSPATPEAREKFPRMGSSSRDVPAASAARQRAWGLLDATVDLIGPTGDTLLWDARYRHGLSAETGAIGGTANNSRGVYAGGAVDPVAADVLDWGRQGGGGLESSTHSRRSAGDRGTPGRASGRAGDGGVGSFLGGVEWGGGGGGDGDNDGRWFVDSKAKKQNPLADAGGVPWMLVRILLAIFVSGGAAAGHAEAGTSGKPSNRCPGGNSSDGSRSGVDSGAFSGVSGEGGGGAGKGPPSIALVALQRLIALLNSLESSGYPHFEFEVLHMAARVSSALRTTRLTPQSAWVLGALQLLAKCLAAQGAQIEDLLVAAEERIDARNDSERPSRSASSSLPATAAADAAEPPLPRARLVFSRGSKPKFWLWDLLTGGGGGGKANRRRRTAPKGVLHQIAAETSLATVPSANLALEIIRRTLGIELPGSTSQQRPERAKKRGGGGTKGSAAAAVVAAPLTWDLLEAAFEPVSEGGAGHEAAGLATRLDRGGMHKLALQVLMRVRALEGRGYEAGIHVPADVRKLGEAVIRMEADRALALAEAKERATIRRQAQWEAVLKQLATERGPWGRGFEALHLHSVYWALSPREDDHGRRLKLLRNPYGSLHTIASERTRGVTRPLVSSSRSSVRGGRGWRVPFRAPPRSEVGGSDFEGSTLGIVIAPAEAGPVPHQADGSQEELHRRLSNSTRTDVREMSAQTSLWRDLCKYQRKSVKVRRGGEGSGDETEDTEEEEEEDDEYDEDEFEDDSDGGDSDSDARGNDDDYVNVGRDGSCRNRRDAASVAFCSAVDVVRPFCATAGMISVEGHRLVFTRLPDADVDASSGNKRQDEAQQPVQDNYRWALRPAPSSSWPISGLRRVLFRPYGGMRFAALEMWFRGGGADDEAGGEGCQGSLLVGLPSESLADGLHRTLRRTRPPALEPFLGRLPATVVTRSKAGTWGASAAGGVGMFVGATSDRRSGGGGSGGGGGGGGMRAAVAATETARAPLTEAWARRRCGVTNFDYLRGLNAAAGRTTADLTRYPVFPWVLSERALRAEELDLTDERNFRDLEWPMGAQRPEQREALHMRYAELERSYLEEQRMGGEMAEMALPPFHHGTHYSTSAYVLWFLVRLEPFTSLHIHLQDGRFDKADRLFQSLPDAYRSCTRNPGDVKEAIPDLYYLPELFVNSTGFDLGCSQTAGKPLGDVELPPWARGDPWEFVRRHREALESEHVSLRLHRWIDLVFGCRHRPPALNGGQRGAVESCNVFFHLTYPGAVDLPRLREQDPNLYESTIRQIEEFGQAPAQLFKSPHPRRLSIAQAEVVRPIASPVPGSNTEPLAEPFISATTASPARAADSARRVESNVPARLALASPTSTHSVVSYPRERVSRGAVLAIADLLPWAERLVTVDARRAIGFHGWRVLPPERSPPFRLRRDAVEADDSMRVRKYDGAGSATLNVDGGSAGAERDTLRVRRIGVPFAPHGVASSRLLEPPPLDRRSSDYRDGGNIFTQPLGSLGGSYDSLASMGSLLSLPQVAAPASEPLHHASLGTSPVDGYNTYQHEHRQHEDARSLSLSLVPFRTNSDVWSGGVGVGGIDNGRHFGGGGTSSSSNGGRVRLGSHLFAFHAESRVLFSGGYWDSTFRVTSLDTGRLIVSIARHRDVVTSLSLADGGAGCRRLVTASRDTTMMVWRVDDNGGLSSSSLLHVLYGHDTPVTCVCARASLDAVVSSGEDGTLVVHTLWGGEYVRTITPQRNVPACAAVPPDGTTRGPSNTSTPMVDGGKEGSSDENGAGGADAAVTTPKLPLGGGSLSLPWPSVGWVGLSAAGVIVAYSPEDATLRSHTINGHAMGVTEVAKAEAGPLRAFAFSEDGSVLLSGGHDRVVTLRWAHSLAVANDGGRKGCGEAVLDGSGPPLAGVPAASAGVKRFGCAIRSLALTAGEQHLLVGLEDGTLGVLALDANYLRRRLRSKLDQLGI